MSEASDDRPFRLSSLAWVGVVTVVLAVFIPALDFDFTNWDDQHFCTQNWDVAHPSLRIFDPSNWVVSDWTPLATVTYAIERRLFGEDPMVPHATNLLLHALSVYLAFRLLRDLGFGPWWSAGVALVFGVHPLQVESVVWVSARKNVLVAVFAFLHLRAFLAGQPLRATLWFVLALLSKATSVGLPLVDAAAQFLALGVPRSRGTWSTIAGWCLLSAARSIISLHSQAQQLARFASYGFTGRMAYMGSVLTTQTRQVFAPTDLCVVYDPPRRAWNDPVLLGQWALIGVIVALCVVAARRDKRLAFLLVFALMMMAPTLNVFPGPCFQADRYLHLPLLAIGAFVVAAACHLARIKPWLPAVPLLAWIGFVLVPLTFERESVWENDMGLWTDATSKTPTSVTAWGHYGAAKASQGDIERSLEALGRALELSPDDETVAFDHAAVLELAGQLEAATREAEALVAKFPKSADPHALLGRLRARGGRLKEARAEFATARAIDPRSFHVCLWGAEFDEQDRNR